MVSFLRPCQCFQEYPVPPAPAMAHRPQIPPFLSAGPGHGAPVQPRCIRRGWPRQGPPRGRYRSGSRDISGQTGADHPKASLYSNRRWLPPQGRCHPQLVPHSEGSQGLNRGSTPASAGVRHRPAFPGFCPPARRQALFPFEASSTKAAPSWCRQALAAVRGGEQRSRTGPVLPGSAGLPFLPG